MTPILFGSLLDDSKEAELATLRAQLQDLEKHKEVKEALEKQLLQKDEKYGHLLGEKDQEIVRLSESHQVAIKQVSDEKDAKLKKLEGQIQNSVQM